ncbi:MAG: hypothetical protein K6L75_03710 [Cellvibrionaceae bacterium]
MFKSIVLHSLVIFIVFLIIGKFDFSLLHNGSVLLYETHDVLFHKPVKNQEGYIWTQGMSRRSYKIAINELGTRGEGQVLSCDKIRILSTGSSSAFGEGLSDQMVWSSLVNTEFEKQSVAAEIYNGGVPGWGLYQWSNFISIYAESFSPEIVFIPMSHGDFWFYPPVEGKAERENWVNSDLKKKAILNYDNVLGYILRKSQYILTAAKTKYFSSKKEGGGPALGEQVDQFEIHFSKQQKYLDELIALSKQHDFKLIFFVRNADFTPAGKELYKKLSNKLSEDNDFFLFEISPADFDSTLTEAEFENYYKENLIIKNDGHPNDYYSRLMADKIYQAITKVIADSSVSAKPCQ